MERQRSIGGIKAHLIDYVQASELPEDAVEPWSAAHGGVKIEYCTS